MDQQISEKITVFKDTAPTTGVAFAECATVKTYRKGSYLFMDREPVDCFYFLVEGYISLHKTSQTMENKVIFICPSGAMINEVMIQDTYASINAQTLSNCVVAVIRKTDFKRMMSEDYQLAEAVMKSMAIKIRRLYRQLKNTPNAVRLDKQIAAKLWKLSRDCAVAHGTETEIGFDISISLLAEMVGAKRETVSRQLKRLVEQGLVRVEKKRMIIPDRGKLAEYVNEM